MINFDIILKTIPVSALSASNLYVLKIRLLRVGKADVHENDCPFGKLDRVLIESSIPLHT